VEATAGRSAECDGGERPSREVGAMSGQVTITVELRRLREVLDAAGRSKRALTYGSVKHSELDDDIRQVERAIAKATKKDAA